MDAVGQAELVRSGEIAPVELVEAACERVQELNPALNAVIAPRLERAREEAAERTPGDAAFAGVPFLTKDMGAFTAGDPMAFGVRAMRELGWRPRRDGGYWRRLRTAGFVDLGKTNIPELALQCLTESPTYGPCANPWAPERSPGGSSGGAASAVAAGLVPAAHANDIGGSIRIPAAWTGLVGLKPTRGRVSWAPASPVAPQGMACELVLTRSVRDTAAILDLLAGPEPGDLNALERPVAPYAGAGDPGRLRVGVLTEARATVAMDGECRDAAEGAGRLLAELGHDVDEAHPAALAQGLDVDRVLLVFAVGAAGDVAGLEPLVGRPLGEEDFEPYTWHLVRLGRELSALRAASARRKLDIWAASIAEWWSEGFDLLITPTMPIPAPRTGELAIRADAVAEGAHRMLGALAFTLPFNLTGQPAVSVPFAMSTAGLPLGVQLVATHGREDLLLRVAAQLEDALAWGTRRPQPAASPAYGLMRPGAPRRSA
jgi:amidase